MRSRKPLIWQASNRTPEESLCCQVCKSDYCILDSRAATGYHILRNTEMQLVCLQRAFVDAQVVMGAVSDPGGIGASFLTFCCQHRENVSLFSGAEPPVTVDYPKQAAHQTSSSLSTGSLTYSRRSFRYRTSSGRVQPEAKVVQDMALTWSSVK